MIIDLRSDTVTKPTPEMLQVMMNAKVGDDVFGEDPSINELERMTAELFGKEAGIYCPTGTMTNQIAIKNHTQPMDEVIVEKSNHVYYYESGGIAFHSLSSVRLINGDRGRIKPSDIEENINPDNIHHPKTKLVVIENTANRGGGSYYLLNEMKSLSDTAHKNNLKIHLDGARIFNCLVEINVAPNEIGPLFDSVSVCLSKGLGCPVGSVLLGNKDFISSARKYRKVFGGGMRQAGFLASAGIYALKNNIQRLKEDHKRAKSISEILLKTGWIESLMPVDTNILIFKLKPAYKAEILVEKLKDNSVFCFAIGGNSIRMVTHLDFSDEMLNKFSDIISKINW